MKLLLNFCFAASICLNASAGFAETIGIGHALGRQSLIETKSLVGLGDILSGVFPLTGLPELANHEMQISSWYGPISQGADEALSTRYSGCGSTFRPFPSNLTLGSGGKLERRLKVPEPPPYFLAGTGLLGMIVLYKAKIVRDRIRTRGAHSDLQTRYW